MPLVTLKTHCALCECIIGITFVPFMFHPYISEMLMTCMSGRGLGRRFNILHFKSCYIRLLYIYFNLILALLLYLPDLSTGACWRIKTLYLPGSLPGDGGS